MVISSIQKNPITLYIKGTGMFKVIENAVQILSKLCAFLNFEKSTKVIESQDSIIFWVLFFIINNCKATNAFFIVLFSFFAKDVVGHLLSAALPWKLNQVIRKLKVNLLHTNVMLKLHLTNETNSFSWLQSKYLRSVFIACNNCTCLNGDAHTTTAPFLQQPLKYQNESNF